MGCRLPDFHILIASSFPMSWYWLSFACCCSATILAKEPEFIANFSIPAVLRQPKKKVRHWTAPPRPSIDPCMMAALQEASWAIAASSPVKPPHLLLLLPVDLPLCR